MTYPGAPWSAAEDARLVAELAAGTELADISAALPERSPSAVVNRAKVLGLPLPPGWSTRASLMDNPWAWRAA